MRQNEPPQEIQGLRGQVVQVDQQLRMVSSPAYSAMDRDKALAEQNVSVDHLHRVLIIVSIKNLIHLN